MFDIGGGGGGGRGYYPVVFNHPASYMIKLISCARQTNTVANYHRES